MYLKLSSYVADTSGTYYVEPRHAVEAGCEDTLEVEDADLRLELFDSVDGALGQAEHKAREDVILLVVSMDFLRWCPVGTAAGGMFSSPRGWKPRTR